MKGVLLASFGSSYETEAVKLVKKDIEKEFPDVKIIKGYSPNMMNYLEKKTGKRDLSYQEAYDKLKTQVDEVYIVSLFLMSGIEYEKVKAIGAPLTSPLLSEEEYYPEIINALEINEEEERAIILVGHGSSHDADIEYGKFKKFINSNSVFITTLEGKTDYGDLFELTKGYKSVKIIPLFLVAGDHVNNDIFGEERSIAEEYHLSGFEVEGEPIGMLEIEGIRRIFIEKLKKIMKED